MTTLAISITVLLTVYLLGGIKVAMDNTNASKKLVKKLKKRLKKRNLLEISNTNMFFYKGRYFEIKKDHIVFHKDIGVVIPMLSIVHLDLILSIIDKDEAELIERMSKI